MGDSGREIEQKRADDCLSAPNRDRCAPIVVERTAVANVVFSIRDPPRFSTHWRFC